MLKQILLAVVVGIAAALATALIGAVLVEVGVTQIGNFVKSISAIAGILVGIWYYLTNQVPGRL